MYAPPSHLHTPLLALFVGLFAAPLIARLCCRVIAEWGFQNFAHSKKRASLLLLSLAGIGKHAGDDKRLSKELHAQLIEEFQTSSPQIAPLSSSAMRLVRQGSREEVVQAASCTSPLGPMSSSQSRRLLIRLIGTLNATFPDYDFSDLRANQFEEVDEIEGIRTEIDSLVLEPAARVLASSSSSGSTVVVGVQAGDLLSKFWDVLDDVICLEDCKCAYLWGSWMCGCAHDVPTR